MMAAPQSRSANQVATHISKVGEWGVVVCAVRGFPGSAVTAKVGECRVSKG
jgi:hypothetical protein